MLGSPGERYREQQMAYQWPKQDLSLTYCKHIPEQQHGSYEDFVAGRNEIALDVAYIRDNHDQATACINCDEQILPTDVAVTAPKFSDRVSVSMQLTKRPLLLN